jgi:hypothetical protein
MKKFFGYLILAVIFAIMYIITSQEVGYFISALIWLVSLATSILIALAIDWIVD